ncbi:hypothetical protein AAEI00_21820, partial [Shewanella algae]|uniref:hypothetical protein n=1 Tax=Shewanella algae TaxID=38313 RepID=UPI0031912CF9
RERAAPGFARPGRHAQKAGAGDRQTKGEGKRQHGEPKEASAEGLTWRAEDHKDEAKGYRSANPKGGKERDMPFAVRHRLD